MIRPHLHFHLGSLFPLHLSKAIKQLFGSVAILGFATSAANLFEPIYLFTLGYSIRTIIVYYLATYAAYFFLIPLGARFACSHGFQRALLLGSLLYIPYYLALFAIDEFPALLYVAPLLFAVQKMFYWVGYHGDFAANATSGEVGREIGEASLVITLVSIIGPLAGGIIAEAFGLTVLFVIVAILIFLSNLPLLSTKRERVAGAFSYGMCYRRLFSRLQRRSLYTYAGYGEDFINTALWPIAIFLIVSDVLKVGSLVTVTAIATSLLLLYLGKLTDISDWKKLMVGGVRLTSVCWLLRIFVSNGPAFVVEDTLYRIGRGAIELPMGMDIYGRAKAGNILHAVVFYEMGLITGKIIVMLLLLGVLAFVGSSWPAIFVTGAIFTLLYGLLPKRAPSFRDPSAALPFDPVRE